MRHGTPKVATTLQSGKHRARGPVEPCGQPGPVSDLKDTFHDALLYSSLLSLARDQAPVAPCFNAQAAVKGAGPAAAVPLGAALVS